MHFGAGGGATGVPLAGGSLWESWPRMLTHFTAASMFFRPLSNTKQCGKERNAEVRPVLLHHRENLTVTAGSERAEARRPSPARCVIALRGLFLRDHNKRIFDNKRAASRLG